ncbi:hypothetical protein LTSEMIN_1513 [Salmonella enterica subsp. enterica serovar Minnesota str. A4-603]|nr:hypothetical protein LTSEMIN_1513 [Salmonella enterica subsp. enterica serovar Minnesota str. A4-603]
MFLASHIDCGMVHREAPGTAIFYHREAPGTAIFNFL